jgi:hypothetical protein
MTDLNIIVGVQSGNAIRQLSNVQKGVDNVGVATRRTTQRLREHATQYNKTAVAANKFGKGLAQQAGYQVADFAVQLQNGTSFLQAFGQQGSQMLAVFGPLGSVLGAVVAVGAALGTVFQKSTISTEGFKDEVKSLRQELDMLLAGAETKGEYEQLEKIEDINARILRFTQAYEKLRNIRGDDDKHVKQRLQLVNSEKIRLKQVTEELTNMQKMREQVDAIVQGKKDEAERAREAAKAEKERQETIQGRMTQSDLMVRQFYANQIKQERELAVLRQKQFDTAQLSLQQQTQIVQTEIALRKELGKKIKDEAELQILLEQQKLSIMNSGKLLTTSQIIQLQDMTREFLEQKGALQEILDLEARRKKALSGVAEISKYIETYGDGLDGAKAAFADWGEMADTSTKKTKELAKTVTNELSPAAQRLVDISNSIGSSFENAMMSAVRGTMSVKDAFRTMAADIIAELYRVFVVKQITGFISSAIMGGMGYTPVEGGGYTMRPRARPRAAGGPVSAGSPYLVGERGPELIVPNRSGTVIPNNKLGGGGVVVNQVINISTGVQQTVRAEIRQLMPQIADSAKAAVSDAKRRGGSYGRAFA